MARVDYTGSAGTYRASRTLPPEILATWPDAIARARLPHPVLVLDVGAGPGGFVASLADWFAAPVVAIEPSAAMRDEARAAGIIPRWPYVAAWTEALPLRPASVDLAWLSTMIHHCHDRSAAIAELRRVVRPGGRVLVRGFFGDMAPSGMFSYFPGMDRSAATFPTTAAITAAFEATGFTAAAVHDVIEPWRPTLDDWIAQVQRLHHVDSALRPLDDDEIAEGIRRVTDAYRDCDGPLPHDTTIRLLVLAA
jgi:ubiquinone/menaquinone biosynthesis C-methylase UbiE